jgi:hypothetical protein
MPLRERFGERVSDRAGSEAELIDVNRGGRCGDVLQHPRIEGAALDEDLGGRRDALLECELQITSADGCGQEPRGMVALPPGRYSNHTTAARIAYVAASARPAYPAAAASEDAIPIHVLIRPPWSPVDTR